MDDVSFGYTMFCDDLRIESSGKLLFIGVYTGVMYVPAFPFTCPLVVHSRLSVPAETSLTSLVYRIYRNSDILVEAAFDDEAIANAVTQAKTTSNDSTDKDETDDMPPGEKGSTVIEMQSTLRITASFDRETALRVRWQTNTGLVKGGILRVRSRSSTNGTNVPDIV